MRLRNARHERFAQLVAAGENHSQAYRKVYIRCLRSSRQHAHRLMVTKGYIQKRIMEIQEKTENQAVLTAIRRREIAREIAENTLEKASDRISAIMADAKLAGDLTEKTETTHLGDPNAPIQVSLPPIVFTPRPRRKKETQE